jgi:hypothetical protein
MHKHHATRHHRRCTSRGGSSDDRNISYVPQNQHQAYHLLFQNMEPPEIASVLNRVWIDPDWEFVARRKGEYDED